MVATLQQSTEINSGEIIMYRPDETIQHEVRMGEETVWLTQQQMAELFDKERTVGRHIRNIYREEELEQNITYAKFAHMGSGGGRKVFRRSVIYQAYNDIEVGKHVTTSIPFITLQYNHHLLSNSGQ